MFGGAENLNKKNIMNLVNILKNCPKGTKLYSTMYGDVTLNGIDNDIIVIDVPYKEQLKLWAGGQLSLKGECLIFPSKDQRNWNKFKISIEKENISKLKPFDKVLVRNYYKDEWIPDFFGKFNADTNKFHTISDVKWDYCIPYDEDLAYTKD